MVNMIQLNDGNDNITLNPNIYLDENGAGYLSGMSTIMPVLDNKTINKNDVIMLDSSGKVFPIESTGSIPFDLPIGSEHTWGVGENPQNPTLTRFVGEKEFIINYEKGRGVTHLIGGSVDSAGTFTYGTPQVANATSSPFYISFAIDKSTYGSATVSGISLTYANGTFATAFTYNVATKTFTFGAVVQLGTGTNFSGLDIASIDANRFIVASSPDEAVYLLTVSGTTTITVTATLSLATTNIKRRMTITVISDTKVVLLFNTTTDKVGVQIVDIAGSALSLGTTAESTYDIFNNTYYTTDILSLSGKFYSATSQSIGFDSDIAIYEFSYDAGTDLVTINNTPKVEPTGEFTLYDISYYQTKNQIIATGSTASNPVITLVDYDTSTFTPQVLDSTGGANFGSSAIDASGDIVVVYNDNNDGVSIYGRIGDIATNLDHTKRIGVAGENVVAGVGNTLKLLIANSVVQAPEGVGLTPNGIVFVSELGVISSVNSSNAINIGRALSSTKYILN